MNRHILHLSIPDFPVAIARVNQSELRERPVAVAPAHTPRATIQATSPEAREEGISPGMPTHVALRLCPSLRIVPPDPALTQRAMSSLATLTSHYTPLWEPERPGRLYLDLSGTGRLLGPPLDIAARLNKEISGQLRLQASTGLATNKLISHIASDYLEASGICNILPGSEKTFIAPLPVSSLPGIGAVRTRLLLDDLNLRHVEELAALSLARLRLVFGEAAPLLQRHANGLDSAPVFPPERPLQVMEEAFLAQEENDDAVLSTAIWRLVEKCSFRLRHMRRGTRHLSLRLHYSDGVTATRSVQLAAPENHEAVLGGFAADLFRKACRRRIRVKSLRLVCSRVLPEKQQLSLFAAEEPDDRKIRLEKSLDLIRNRYGMDKISWGRHPAVP
jgi:DNA polymerase IV